MNEQYLGSLLTELHNSYMEIYVSKITAILFCCVSFIVGFLMGYILYPIQKKLNKR